MAEPHELYAEAFSSACHEHGGKSFFAEQGTRAAQAAARAVFEAGRADASAELEAVRAERDRLAERVARCEARLREAAGRWLRLAKATGRAPSADAEDRRESATLRDCANELDAIRAALASAERSEPQQGAP